MNLSNKALIITVAVIGISASPISLVSAHGGFNRFGGYGGGFGGPQPWQHGYGPMMQQRGFNKYGGGFGGPPPWQHGYSPMMQQRGFNKDFGFGMEQFMRQRLDQAKYLLRITEEQEPAWHEFTEEVGKKAATMRNRMQQRWAQQTVTERIKHMRNRADQMTLLASVIEKLYKTLTPEQQKIADQFNLMRMCRF